MMILQQEIYAQTYKGSGIVKKVFLNKRKQLEILEVLLSEKMYNTDLLIVQTLSFFLTFSDICHDYSVFIIKTMH